MCFLKLCLFPSIFEHRQETFDFDDIIQANPVSVQSRNDQLQWCGPCVRCPRFRPLTWLRERHSWQGVRIAAL